MYTSVSRRNCSYIYIILVHKIFFSTPNLENVHFALLFHLFTKHVLTFNSTEKSYKTNNHKIVSNLKSAFKLKKEGNIKYLTIKLRIFIIVQA